MGIDFLVDYGAQRVHSDSPRPLLIDDAPLSTEDIDERIDLDVERSAESWEPVDVQDAADLNDRLRPRRYIDGKDVGQTVAWLRSDQGYPIPVRLFQIGAIAIRDIKGELRRESYHVERGISFVVDPFPWDEVESFAIALRPTGFRLLPCLLPGEGPSFDFAKMRQATYDRSRREMARLERLVFTSAPRIPTVVDGLLSAHAGAFDQLTTPVVGLIKTPRHVQLHETGWRTLYDLDIGHRTPAFSIREKNIAVVSWFLRLNGQNGEMPNDGVVRVEVPAQFFASQIGNDWRYVNQLSRYICDCRCRDNGYSRAAISIHPIKRAEEMLGATFARSSRLISQFYRITKL